MFSKKISYYFSLQVQRIQRKFVEIGIPPLVGYILLFILFIALSKFLFYKTTYAAYIYVAFTITFLLQLGATNRTDLLYAIYQKKDYYRIRLIENSLLIVPFTGYLLYEKSYWMILVLIASAVLLALIAIKQQRQFTIPTPFRKIPFELIVGFRKSLVLFLIAYFLVYKAMEVGNANLSLAAIGLIFLTTMSFYFQPESTYFVWIYKKTINEFLLTKIGHAFMGVSLLTLPIWIAVIAMFPANLLLLLGVQMVGYMLLLTIILAKYSAFPHEINLPQAVLFGLSFLFPPLFLVIIPIFYSQSRKRLLQFLMMNEK